MLSIFTAAAWNAGSFYFHVFSREYETQLQEKVKEKRGAKTETTTQGESATPVTQSKVEATKLD